MNKNYHAIIGITKSGMYYGIIKYDVFGDKSYMAFVGSSQDFTANGVLHYLHGHGVPYTNVTVSKEVWYEEENNLFFVQRKLQRTCV